ncbi:MAG: leucyl/phenylalanyl-tRNA--protein transferase [Nitrospiraceae bacterium]|nr:MAG: leucyl/phenylalanyl-tRNA--protein transferase [Nitrospiraceae bacterium]
MPVFQLTDELIFPPPELAEEGGLLAIGGDLTRERLLLAYEMGIFPWSSEGDPILWWSPDPRMVLFPEEIKVGKSLRQAIRRKTFTITMDCAFESVIRQCSSVHSRADNDTWITSDMISAYLNLHHSGFAHSVEAWHDKNLVGGLYGVALGKAFFGESMFTIESNASKVAFVYLTEQLSRWGFTMIDCQITTGHLMSFGAREIPRKTFLLYLRSALKSRTRKGRWVMELDNPFSGITLSHKQQK